MPLVRQLLITLRTLMEDDPQPPPRNRRRRANSGGRANRNRQTTALVLTFRDLFRSGGLNIIFDEMDNNRRQNRKNSHNVSCASNPSPKATETALCTTNQSPSIPYSRLTFGEQNALVVTTSRPLCHQDETIPLMQEDFPSVSCTDVIPSPMPIYPGGFFSNFALVRRKQKQPKNVTVPLNPDDENKTVETLKKVLKWSPRKQNSATFAVAVPAEEKHTALAVVENAVNRVKEEQLTRKKKKKFLWLKFC